jgi:endonuclease G
MQFVIMRGTARAVMKNVDAWVRRLISRLDAADGQLAAEIRGLRGLRGARSLSSRTIQHSLRNIVLRVGRPVLAIVGGVARLEFSDSESDVWRERLQNSSERLGRAAQAVGRIDVTGMPPYTYVGTGWLVDKDLIVTNRHVARTFGRKAGGRFTFKQGTGSRPVKTSIDFLEEAGRRERLEYPIVEIVHIESDAGPDFAVLRLDRSERRAIAPPIPLSASPARAEQQVAVIGYPARDSRVPDDQLMQSIFGNVYNKKRLAPGQVTKARADVLLHDCSTLGGNSGSVVLDLATGEAVGLHFAGRFLETNFAVPAAVVADRLERVRRGKPGKPIGPLRPRPPKHDEPPPVVGEPIASNEPIEEGVPADYVDRRGYDSRFVGPEVPLPRVADPHDVLTFAWQGGVERELKYEHFSVVMSRSRRLCIFSAANVDGARPQRFKRPPWRLDPRIARTQQIIEECYGNEPLFARGHMTRREDPVWGDPDSASLGNRDSMHVTNTVPQMQPFNAGIWLGLESYALDHARSDHMRIAVFTGPFLLADDPVRADVRIPRSFWKVIAFVHDETRELCATGYTMSQEDFLRDEEFVFAQHKTAQTRIATIEARTGLSFGPLAALDPFDDDEEGVIPVLTDPSQIRFRRR